MNSLISTGYLALVAIIGAANAAAPAPVPSATPTSTVGEQPATAYESWIPAGEAGFPIGSLALLADGTVLEAGGQGPDGAPLASAAIFDPSTGTWARTGDLITPRGLPLLVALPDGRALVAGGFATAQGDAERALASAELYDPVTGAWTDAGSMSATRVYASALLLSDGRVLVAGGASPSEYLASTEIFDPETGAWAESGTMLTPRAGGMARLSDGRVLIAGGGSRAAEVFDPSTGIWSGTGPMITSRDDVQAVTLDDGRVLVSGGGHDFGSASELYDAVTGWWSAAASMLEGRSGHAAVVLSTGQVLIAGGQPGDGQQPLKTAEIYDPVADSWRATASMTDGRLGPSAVLLRDGRVLVAGGFGSGFAPLGSAELFDPLTPEVAP
jgi:hypothetical protein